MTDQIFRLKNGYQLGYTEHGDPNGRAVFFVHGNPGSRLMRHPDESIARDVGARIITPDRPGYGLSDYQPDRKLLDFPLDIAELADALGIDDFAIFGTSAGGPYTAATAYKLPDRVRAAAIVSGVSPINRDHALDQMDDAMQKAFRAAQKTPMILLRPLIEIQARAIMNNPEQAQEDRRARMSPADWALIVQPVYQQQFDRYYVEAMRQGAQGWAKEVKILVEDWGFPLEAIKPTVHLWYWEHDTTVPPQMGRYLEKHIPHTVPHFLPEGGHLGIFTHWREILEPLVE